MASWSFYLEKCFGPEEALLIPRHPGHLPRAATVDGGATVCPPLMASVPASGAEMGCARSARTQRHSGSLGLIFLITLEIKTRGWDGEVDRGVTGEDFLI